MLPTVAGPRFTRPLLAALCVSDMDWSQMGLFKGIDLNDSFVLSWEQVSDQLSFELEVSVWPESDYYTSPNKGEYTCYRKGRLQFVDVESSSGLKPIESVRPAIDQDGSVDYGNIDSLQKTELGYELSGDFGTVKIVGGELRFEIHT